MNSVKNRLENRPIIAAVKRAAFQEALESPADVIFLLNADILTVSAQIQAAHRQKKLLFVHIDLAEGIGKDKAGITFLKQCEVDGIISTRSGLIRTAKEKGLCTVLRIFALDSQGVSGAGDVIRNAAPDFVEIMPGIADKVIGRLSHGDVPVIAGGLIETKQEVCNALGSGAIAISTGKKELWSV